MVLTLFELCNLEHITKSQFPCQENGNNYTISLMEVLEEMR